MFPSAWRSSETLQHLTPAFPKRDKTLGEEGLDLHPSPTNSHRTAAATLPLDPAAVRLTVKHLNALHLARNGAGKRLQ